MQTKNMDGLRDLIWFTFHLLHQRNIFNKQTHPPYWGELFPLVPELRGDEKTLSFRLTFWLQGHQKPKVSYWLCINQSDRFWNQKSDTGLTWETVQAGHPSCRQTGQREKDKLDDSNFTDYKQEYFSTSSSSSVCTCSGVCTWRRVLICS